jgi:hypothetical protein
VIPFESRPKGRLRSAAWTLSRRPVSKQSALGQPPERQTRINSHLLCLLADDIKPLLFPAAMPLRSNFLETKLRILCLW